jgi:hypothetical protein
MNPEDPERRYRQRAPSSQALAGAPQLYFLRVLDRLKGFRTPSALGLHIPFGRPPRSDEEAFRWVVSCRQAWETFVPDPGPAGSRTNEKSGFVQSITPFRSTQCLGQHLSGSTALP